MPPIEGHLVTTDPGYIGQAEIDSRKTEISGDDMFVEHFPPAEKEPIFTIARGQRHKIGEVIGTMGNGIWDTRVSTI